MNKLFTVSVAALGLGLGFMGCDLLPTNVKESEAAKVTMNMPDTLQLSTTTGITGKITADENITGVQYSILNSSGAVATGVTVAGPSVSGDKTYEFKGLVLTITVGATAAAGTYQLQLVVTAGPVATVAFPFHVKGGTVVVEDTLTPKQVTLGAAAAAAGSSLDADIMAVYTSAQVTAAIQPTIDVWFAVTAANEPKLYSPSAAATNGWGPKNWTVQNATTFVKAPATVSFDATKTQTAIDAIWTAGATSAASSVQIAAGDVVIVKTSTGNRLLQIVSAGTTTAGTAVITGKIK